MRSGKKKTVCLDTDTSLVSSKCATLHRQVASKYRAAPSRQHPSAMAVMCASRPSCCTVGRRRCNAAASQSCVGFAGSSILKHASSVSSAANPKALHGATTVEVLEVCALQGTTDKILQHAGESVFHRCKWIAQRTRVLPSLVADRPTGGAMTEQRIRASYQKISYRYDSNR
jgi:hypothetical protein